MIVLLYDVEWNEGRGVFPNYKLQKTSSYHRQLGDTVHMIDSLDYEMSYKYDLLYIFREDPDSPMIPSRLIDVDKVRLVGEEFIFYDNYFYLTKEMTMVAPDYIIYDSLDKDYDKNESIVNLIHENKIVPLYQDFLNRFGKRSIKCVIVDDPFELDTDEELLKYLEMISRLRRVSFHHPISAKRMYENADVLAAVLELDFNTRKRIIIKNDLGDDLISAAKIVKIIKDILEYNPTIIKPIFEIKSVTTDHWENMENVYEDMERCFQIADLLKENNVNGIILAPQENETPYREFFFFFEQWTSSFGHMSYIEFMTLFVRAKKNHRMLRWFDVVNNPIYWRTDRVAQLVYLMAKRPKLIFSYGSRKYGDVYTDLDLIDLPSVAKIEPHFNEGLLIKNMQEAIEEITK